MSTTPSAIFTAALAKNRKNQPGVIATPAELLALFTRLYPVFWTIGARVNPAFFGARAVLLEDGESFADGWVRPSDAELIFMIKNADGDRITIVAPDELDADPTEPAVYEWGQAFYPAGNPNDPSVGDDDLTAWYSKVPDTPETAAEVLEALWPEQFNELLALELAICLAIKDERAADVALLRPDRDVWLRRFIAHLEHATLGVTRSTGTAQRFTGPTFVPLNLLLAGGTEVAL